MQKEKAYIYRWLVRAMPAFFNPSPLNTKYIQSEQKHVNRQLNDSHNSLFHKLIRSFSIIHSNDVTAISLRKGWSQLNPKNVRGGDKNSKEGGWIYYLNSAYSITYTNDGERGRGGGVCGKTRRNVSTVEGGWRGRERNICSG